MTVKPDRTAYLTTEPAHVTVTSAYLFGKPVAKGHVKLVRTDPPRWNPQTRKSELADGDSARFEDIHFEAYYTDTASHRTEQRRFDLPSLGMQFMST